MRVVIAGDFCLNHRLKTESINESTIVSDEIKSRIVSSHYSIVNLECPIINDGGEVINKIGPAISNTSYSVSLIKKLGFSCVTLANNHIKDYGGNGVNNTILVCKDAGIDYVGAGPNITEASRVLYKSINNETLGIINCCEHEFSIATDNSAGACPLDISTVYYAIKEAHKNADYVLVIIHGGHENWQYPSKRMQDTYRLFVDFGANAVINHHQHCWSGYEVYNNAPIFYGLGNFCFDWEGKTNCSWNEGFIVELDFSRVQTCFNTIPYNQCNSEPVVKRLTIDEQKSFIERINGINQTISDPLLLKEVNDKFFCQSSPFYCDFARPLCNRLILALKSRGLFPRIYSKKWRTRLLSIIQCESHREKFIFSLKR